MVKKGSGATNSSAIHVFEVMRLVAETDEQLGVSEISRRLGLPASTVYRALITLEDSDYLVRHQNTPRYELGPIPHLLNRALVHRFKLHASSRPILQQLADATGETVSLTVRVGWYGLRLAGIYGSSDIYHRDRLGEVGLLHRSLHGRGILAFLSAQEMAAYRNFVLRHHASEAPEDWDALACTLAAERQAGLAHEPLAPGDEMMAVALPVGDTGKAVIASLAISGPVYAPSIGTADPQWTRACAALEAEIVAAPAEFVSPFAGVPVDEIVIQTRRRTQLN